MFQPTRLVPGGGPNFAVKISSGGSVFINKLVPGGTIWGGGGGGGGGGGVHFYHDKL